MLRFLLKFVGILILAVIVIQVIWYQIDGIPAAEANQFLQGDEFSVSEESNGSFWFHSRYAQWLWRRHHARRADIAKKLRAECCFFRK